MLRSMFVYYKKNNDDRMGKVCIIHEYILCNSLKLSINITEGFKL
jgi:hypothetical protein